MPKEITRINMAKVNGLPAHALGRLQSASGEELRPFFGPLRALTSSPSAASGMPSVLRPQGGAFKGEL
ncbi:MAG: hypothetical protein ABIU06_01780 [Anaerolineales bacterium]